MEVFFESLINSLNWTWQNITFQVPWYLNYFWGLTLISLIVWLLEIAFPWRKNQAVFRKDFFLDLAYMYFNFFAFSIAISGVYALVEEISTSFGLSMADLTLIPLGNFPSWVQLLIFFILLDFVQWFTHILLHRYKFLWNFHKVHHSVKEMGFAAHLRYHWMENILYKPLKTLAIMLLGGFEPEQAYVVHFFAISIGHLNHANLNITWGPLKYVLNNPVMHLYHHAYTLPNKYGANFGISLSLWDYLFRTNYIPEVNPNEKLGFEGDEHFPKDFIGQNLYGFSKKRK